MFEVKDVIFKNPISACLPSAQPQEESRGMITMGWLLGISFAFFCIFGSHSYQTSSVREITVTQGRQKRYPKAFLHMSLSCVGEVHQHLSLNFSRERIIIESLFQQINTECPLWTLQQQARFTLVFYYIISLMAIMLASFFGRIVNREDLYNASPLVFSLTFLCQQRLHQTIDIFILAQGKEKYLSYHQLYIKQSTKIGIFKT